MYFSESDIMRAEHEAIKAAINDADDDYSGMMMDTIRGIIKFTDALIAAQKEKEGS